MRLVTFDAGAGPRLGALIGEARIADLARAGSDKAFASMQALIEAGERGLDAARRAAEAAPEDALIERSEARLLPPLPAPARLRDCSLFLDHMEKALDNWAKKLAANEADPEAALRELRASGRFSLKPIFKQQVIYYNADHNGLSGDGDDVAWPSNSQWIDYELEWACVVGASARNVKAENARAHIFGYTIFNDWSLRDIQMQLMEANLGPGEGKDFAGGNSLGPCIATPDEFEDPYKLTMLARVNGEEWSRGSTSTMHHSFEDAIAQFSRAGELRAGEIIGSGTVLTGCGFELDRKLKDGDVVELEVEGIGVLRNRVVRG